MRFARGAGGAWQRVRLANSVIPSETPGDPLGDADTVTNALAPMRYLVRYW